MTEHKLWNSLTQDQRDELEQLIANGVERAFRDVGFNRKDVFEFRKDLTFLREWRLMCDSVRSKSLLTLVTLGITGLVGLLLIGFTMWFKGH